MVTDRYGFMWGWCDVCNAYYVRCSDCGNNCCNGGTENLPDGTICGCSAAYNHQENYTCPLEGKDENANKHSND